MAPQTFMRGKDRYARVGGQHRLDHHDSVSDLLQLRLYTCYMRAIYATLISNLGLVLCLLAVSTSSRRTCICLLQTTLIEFPSTSLINCVALSATSCVRDIRNAMTLFHTSHQVPGAITTWSNPCCHIHIHWCCHPLQMQHYFCDVFVLLRGRYAGTSPLSRAKDVFKWLRKSCYILQNGRNAIGQV